MRSFPALPGRPRPRRWGITRLILADLVGKPGDAYGILDPGHDAGWFAWLHTAGVLVKMHTVPALLEASYVSLKRFAVQDFAAMYPQTVRFYQRNGYEERVFADLIRPQVKGPQAINVLRTALGSGPPRESVFAEHREVRARATCSPEAIR